MREISGNCEFTWKIKGGRKFTMKIETLEGDKIINLLVDNLKKFGIDYSISTKTLGPKEGVIPSIDIDIVESQIKEIEEKIKKEDTAEMVKFLMVLYEKAVQYYSAINNERYEVFTKKIKDMMAESRYRDVFEQKDNGNSDNLNKDKQSDKEAQKDSISEENKKIDSSKKETLNKDEKENNLKIDNEIKKEETKQEELKPEECKEEIKEEKKDETMHEEKRDELTVEDKKEKKPLLMNIIKDEEKKEDNKQNEEVKEEAATTVKVSVKKEDLNFDFDDD